MLNVVHDRISLKKALCQPGILESDGALDEFSLRAEVIMQTVEAPILISIERVMEMLDLTNEQVTWLSNTGQLQPIHICDQTRFDVRDVRSLVDSYRMTQARRKCS